MAVTVKIPAQLRPATGGEGEIEVDAGTVGDALDAVFDKHDGLMPLRTDDAAIEGFSKLHSYLDLRGRIPADVVLEVLEAAEAAN